jgi:tetratricopeptide (TPR) repeat protein
MGERMPKSKQRFSAIVRTQLPAGRARLSHRSDRGAAGISDDELAALREEVLHCRRVRALNWVKHREHLLRSVDPSHPNTPALIGYLAQWADSAGSLAENVAQLLNRIPAPDRALLPLGSYLSLRFAEGVVNFVLGKPDCGDIDFVITVASSGCVAGELRMLAHLWKAEIARQKGDLNLAAFHARQSNQMAWQSEHPALAARAQAIEALSMLDHGSPHALESLRQAEVVLTQSEDSLWVGRVQEGFGRAAMDEGRYQSALEHFTSAKDLFDHCCEPHAELGYAWLGMARAQRLTAARLAGAIDASAEVRRRSLRSETVEAQASNGPSRQRLEQLRGLALSALAEAEAVFWHITDERATELVALERIALWTDCGDLQRAAEHAHECFVCGKRRKDGLFMAQVRLLQSRIERTCCEEGLGPDVTHHAQCAYEYAKEALVLALECGAKPCVKRRLLAGAYVSQGLVLMNELFHNTEGARECCHAASEHLVPTERDELWDEYQKLTTKTLHSRSLDSKLRKWAEGLPEGKSFQQITEEFAEMVIPAVWAREGKNISRVVTRLSISPKKVRRILTRVGLNVSRTELTGTPVLQSLNNDQHARGNAGRGRTGSPE